MSETQARVVQGLAPVIVAPFTSAQASKIICGAWNHIVPQFKDQAAGKTSANTHFHENVNVPLRICHSNGDSTEPRNSAGYSSASESSAMAIDR